MLGWLFPRTPVAPYDKAWLEYRFAWLVEQLGERRLLDAKVIEPTDDDFPDVYRGENSDAERMYRRVCGFMQVNPAEMRFEVLPADELPGANGLYIRSNASQLPVLRVADKQIGDPEALVATLAHEVSHHILLGGQLMTGDEADHELVTDLLPCVLGLGIFAANSTIRYQYGTEGRWHWWELTRRGYMPSHWIGYALALFAWLRDEHRPAWKLHLRLDAREPMTKGLRYLRRTSDCYLLPEQLGTRRQPTLAHLASQMDRGTPSARIAALWDLSSHEGAATQSESVRRLLHHRDADVRRAAVETAAALQLQDEQTTREITNALRDSSEDVRAAAARALGQLQPDDDDVVFELGQALRDQVSEVVRGAAEALLPFGRRASLAEEETLRTLHDALIDCDYELIDTLIELLRTASTDAGQSINGYFFERDPEFRQIAIDALYSGEIAEISYEDDLDSSL